MKATDFLHIIKPGIPKRYLFFVAAILWTFGGGMLLIRGFSTVGFESWMKFLEVGLSVSSGILFYVFMFSKISGKHILRIQNIALERPCLFSFFDFRSYILMSVMISFGVGLRLSGWIPMQTLSFFYIIMGTPLFFSSIRFYYSGVMNFRN